MPPPEHSRQARRAHGPSYGFLRPWTRLINQRLMLMRINSTYSNELMQWQLTSSMLPKETRLTVKNLHNFLTFGFHINDVTH